jgi:hypothetical protein
LMLLGLFRGQRGSFFLSAWLAGGFAAPCLL